MKRVEVGGGIILFSFHLIYSLSFSSMNCTSKNKLKKKGVASMSFYIHLQSNVSSSRFHSKYMDLKFEYCAIRTNKCMSMRICNLFVINVQNDNLMTLVNLWICDF